MDEFVYNQNYRTSEMRVQPMGLLRLVGWTPQDVAAAPVEPESGDVRYYDLHMTWDKYYSVPRFWLVGHSMDRTLSADEVFEDVSADHAGNTITWDRHPHEIYSAASIHPCRHASTMKKLGDLKVASGEEFLVDQ